MSKLLHLLKRPNFKKIMSDACPHWNVPSRRTLTRDIVGIYFEEKAKLKTFIKQQCERVYVCTRWNSTYFMLNPAIITAEKHGTFLGFIIFLGTEEYN
jgi:hypothetical protein